MNKFALTRISYGLYIVSSKKGEKLNGQCANTVFQATSSPPAILISINKKNLTHEFISESGVFTISVLSQETPFKFIGHFGFRSGRDIDKLKDVHYRVGKTGAPIILENTIAYIECEVIDNFDTGTHTVFLGRIVDADILKDGIPMTYDYYHRVIKGKEPETAPTFLGKKKED